MTWGYLKSAFLFSIEEHLVFCPRLVTHSIMSSSSTFITFKCIPYRKFFFWNILSLQNSSKLYQFPLTGRNWKHHIILNFSWCVWTSTDYEPFVSFVVLVCISWKLGVRLHYPFVLRSNHVFNSYLFYGIGVLLFFRGSLWTALLLVYFLMNS